VRSSPLRFERLERIHEQPRLEMTAVGFEETKSEEPVKWRLAAAESDLRAGVAQMEETS
jgi:hypothetical protein